MTQRNDFSRYGAHVNHHTDNERIRDERVPDPYETQRSQHSYATEQVPPRWSPDPSDDFAHQGLSRDQFRSTGMYQPPRATSPWEQQPARYGGGYRDDEPEAPPPRRAQGPGEGWRQPRGPDEHNRYGRGQSNSGYRTAPDLGERAQEGRFMGPGEYSGTHDPNLSGHYDSQGRGAYGAQGDRLDTYGSAGYRQQGKRYRFDERGQASAHRGVAPRGYVRSDDRLREIVCERLTEADLDASDIEVQVADGIVTLDGSVPDRQTRHLAEDVVDDCGGVKDIHNNLRVGRDRSEASAADATVTDESARSESSGRKH